MSGPPDLFTDGPAWADRLWREGGLILAPVRHHSPACARAVARLIRQRRPAAVLVEGPADATPLIPLLLDADTRPPVALYALAGDEAGRRRATLYPLCDYSPELVALREGAAVGARLAFIDLDSAAYARLTPPAEAEEDQAGSRMAEKPWRASPAWAALTARMGARDPHEAWDRLFEADPDPEPRRFFAGLAAFGALVRGDLAPGDLAADGTLAREQAMARAIRQALAQESETVVVCGAAHAPALLDRLAGDAEPPVPAAPAEDNASLHLIAYGFERLEALNGYAAGMPAPAWQQRLWQRPDPVRAAAELLADLAADLRRDGIAPVSLPDVTAALAQARGLAALRGHGAPGREEVMDAVRSCFCKGETSAEGLAILAAAQRKMTGDRVGSVPPKAGQPPLLADIRRRAAALGLDLTVSAGREVSLDIHRKPRHLARSRFLHALAFLEAPGVEWRRGPDLVAGRDLDLLMEHWRVGWTPGFDAVLIDRAVLGTTLDGACLARLERELAKPGGDAARRAAGLLATACRMGLAGRLPSLLGAVEDALSADADLVSQTAAAHLLLLLLRVRVPLGAIAAPPVAALAAHCWRRLCALLPDEATASDTRAEEVLRCLVALQEMQYGGGADLPADLFLDAVDSLADAPSVPPLLEAAAAGILHRGGRLTEAALARHIIGLLREAEGDGQTDVLCGVAATARQLLWASPAVLSAVNSLVAGWDEETFLCRLPDLRLAYARLAPSERAGLARLLAAENGAPPSLPERATDGLAGLNEALEAALAADGLSAWEAP